MTASDESKSSQTDLKTVIGQKRKILIMCHNNPDPDCLASAFGLMVLFQKAFKRKVTIAYGGIIGRAENRQFLRRLKIPLTHVQDISFQYYSVICLVDTQPGTGNNSLPTRVKAQVVIDHHPFKKETGKCDYFDVRPKYGSSATIVHEYLKKYNVPIDKKLATALFYGLKTDTNNFIRSMTAADISAFNSLFPKVALKTLGAIERPAIPKNYYSNLVRTLQNSRLFQDVLVSHLGSLQNPDGVAEMAEFLLRMENIRWTLCLGEYQDVMYLSVRTSRRGWYAGTIASKMLKGLGSGGGHEKTAGGQVNLSDYDQQQRLEIEKEIILRFLAIVGVSEPKGKPLITEKSTEVCIDYLIKEP